MMRVLGFGAALTAALCACSSGSIGGGGGSSSSSSSGTTGGAGGSGTTSGTGGSVLAECKSAQICDNIFFGSDCGGTGSSSSGGGGGDGGPDTASVTAARCALQKLRDHEVGYVAIFDIGLAPQGCGDRTEITSFGDGSASLQSISYADIGVTAGTPVRVKLQDKSYFDTCLAGPDDGLQACLNGVTTQTIAAGPTCPCRGKPGWQSGQCTSPFGG